MKQILQTPRLLLRPFTVQDAPALCRLLQLPEVHRFLPLFPPRTVQETSQMIQSRFAPLEKEALGGRYAIQERETGALAGYVTLDPADSHDLGYALGRSFWNKGYAQEACREVIQAAKEQGLPYLTATHDRDNVKSGAVMQRLGMRYCYSYRELWQPKNISVVFRLYQLDLQQTVVEDYPEYKNRYSWWVEPSAFHQPE